MTKHDSKGEVSTHHILKRTHTPQGDEIREQELRKQNKQGPNDETRELSNLGPKGDELGELDEINEEENRKKKDAEESELDIDFEPPRGP